MCVFQVSEDEAASSDEEDEDKKKKKKAEVGTANRTQIIHSQ